MSSYVPSQPPLDAGAVRFLREARHYPLLSPEEETRLARAWRTRQDREAADRLVTAHLRLVGRIALGYRAYGLPLSELISEGSIGMMRAIKGYDPERGFRLSTYARWWIRAAIQEYILRSWSIVKIGTTASQKRLFFRLQHAKRLAQAMGEGDLDPDQVARIARMLDVREPDVIALDRRLGAPDQSLNAPRRDRGGREVQWQDILADPGETPEASVAARQQRAHRSRQLADALAALTDRERHIFVQRELRERRPSFRELSEIHKISGERVRQIHAHVVAKLQHRLARDAEI